MTEYFTVENEEGDRIDRYLAEEMPERSRSYLQKLIKEQYIKVNNKPVKANYRLVLGDRVEVCIPEAKEPDIEPENIPLDILYEDEDVIVVNKPKQMVVHPAPGHYSGTLVNALMYHCGNELSGINGTSRPGIVHRIDMDTSGLLVVAKTNEAHQKLAEQLENHTMERAYLALVHGVIPHEDGTIDAPIARMMVDRKKRTVADGGKKAVTHFEVIERFRDFTLLKLRLETGRTHQIRVHMKYIGHPLAGDPMYGPAETLGGHGQYLHAATLGFIHPKTGEKMHFEAPLPDFYSEKLTELRKN